MIAKPITFIIKATTSCNLDCKYCYENSRRSHPENMGGNIHTIINNLLDVPNKTIVMIWHGGEPTLLPVEFYSKAIDIQTRYRADKKIYNNIQTNLTSLDDEYIEFFQNNKFNISCSLDGPQFLHDNMRSNFVKIIRNIQRLRERGIDISAICVLHRNNVSHILEIYEFFESNGINFKINPIISSDACSSLNITSSEYGNAMIKLFDLWYNNQHSNISIGNFDIMLTGFTRGYISYCVFSDTCFRDYFAIYPGGDVTPCDGLLNSEYILGNIFEDRMSKIITSKKLKRLYETRSNNIKTKCSKCNYYKYCYGGCPRNHAEAAKIAEKDYYCLAYKMLFHHVESKLGLIT